MALIFRLASKRFGSQILNAEKTGLYSFVRTVALQAQPATSERDESYDEKNMRLKRPLSPHLTIFAPQLTSVLSITHRFTGMALSGYAIALGLGAVVLPESIPHYIEELQSAQLGTACISSLKFLLAFPLTYHFWNGIRHLLWDTGKFLTLREVYITGYVMLVLAFSSAVALSVM
ncbi:succinate dehydrogenase cytochrome b560 subunit, mitochondrial-like [Anoplophora glabripennis]|uniref:succinate dehydrogenase cytochrome b560 subunit, mitochondrial-like n=1 Tax=Anoplophora glabripennis TaxID=217634 RepID=UPI0008744260|nr:succinate dehydrogenase cytochrome b560 subunit, mitochondrial-like [Anoplophora glabripennis]